MWNREHGTLIDTLEGHTASCNCVSWNPVEASMFASAGDDREIRMYVPVSAIVDFLDGQMRRFRGLITLRPLRKSVSVLILEAFAEMRNLLLH